MGAVYCPSILVVIFILLHITESSTVCRHLVSLPHGSVATNNSNECWSPCPALHTHSPQLQPIVDWPACLVSSGHCCQLVALRCGRPCIPTGFCLLSLSTEELFMQLILSLVSVILGCHHISDVDVSILSTVLAYVWTFCSRT